MKGAAPRRRATGHEPGPGGQGPLGPRGEMTQLKSLTLRNNLQLREAELELRRLEQALGKLRVEHLEEKTQRLLGSTRFAEQDLAAKLALLDSLEAELRDELQATQTRLRETSQQWLHAQQALERGAGDPPAEDAAEPWNLLRQSQEEQASLLNQTLRDLAVCRLCCAAATN